MQNPVFGLRGLKNARAYKGGGGKADRASEGLYGGHRGIVEREGEGKRKKSVKMGCTTKGLRTLG